MNADSYHRLKSVWHSRRRAEAYRDERFSRSRRWRWTGRRERAIVVQFLSDLPEGSRVLDIPCGAGRLIPLFQEAGASFVGADVSLPMLNLARQASGAFSLLATDALRLPFSERSFEALTAVRLLHRIKEQEIRVGMLREMARVVRGTLLVTYYARWNLRGIKRWLQGDYPGMSLAQIRQDAHLAGLRVCRGISLRRWTQQQWFFILERTKPT